MFYEAIPQLERGGTLPPKGKTHSWKKFTTGNGSELQKASILGSQYNSKEYDLKMR